MPGACTRIHSDITFFRSCSSIRSASSLALRSASSLALRSASSLALRSASFSLAFRFASIKEPRAETKPDDNILCFDNDVTSSLMLKESKQAPSSNHLSPISQLLSSLPATLLRVYASPAELQKYITSRLRFSSEMPGACNRIHSDITFFRSCSSLRSASSLALRSASSSLALRSASSLALRSASSLSKSSTSVERLDTHLANEIHDSLAARQLPFSQLSGVESLLLDELSRALLFVCMSSLHWDFMVLYSILNVLAVSSYFLCPKQRYIPLMS